MGSKLAAKITSSHKNITSCLQNINTSILERSLNEKEVKDAFFALKTNKTPGFDKLNVNVIKKLYHKLKILLIFSVCH